jgi:hypothetical protein
LKYFYEFQHGGGLCKKSFGRIGLIDGRRMAAQEKAIF